MSNSAKPSNTVTLPAAGGSWHLAVLLSRAGAKHGGVSIIAAQGGDIIVVGAEHDLPTVPTWHKDRVIIIGDAAHAASTSSGQGASMALEDAVTLGRCVRDCATVQDVHHLRAAPPRPGRRGGEAGAKTASSKAAGPLAAIIRDATMRFGFRFFYKPESAAWLLRHHMTWDQPATSQPAST